MKKYILIQSGENTKPYVRAVIQVIKEQGNHVVSMNTPSENQFSFCYITEESYNEHVEKYEKTKRNGKA
jgi:hypothetical protein